MADTPCHTTWDNIVGPHHIDYPHSTASASKDSSSCFSANFYLHTCNRHICQLLLLLLRLWLFRTWWPAIVLESGPRKSSHSHWSTPKDKKQPVISFASFYSVNLLAYTFLSSRTLVIIRTSTICSQFSTGLGSHALGNRTCSRLIS